MRKPIVFTSILLSALISPSRRADPAPQQHGEGPRASVQLASNWSESYESYYLHLWDHPVYEEPGWHEDVQGIATDGAHWYITQSDTDASPEQRSLWRIPVGNDLANDAEPDVNGVERVILDDIAELGGLGYDHLGDLTYYYNEDYDKKGYLVIPVEDLAGGTGLAPAIAVFGSSNLEYKGHALLNQVAPQSNAGWAAIDPQGFVCTSSWKTSFYYRFNLR